MIKLEVDTNPASFGSCENALVRFPFPFSLRAHDLPRLCAGKCLAVLCREYDKGRDWFDFLWYVSQKITPNLKLLTAGLEQNGPWKGQRLEVTSQFLHQALHKKVDAIDWKAASNEVRPFLTSPFVADVKNWNSDYFHSAVNLFL